MKNLSHYELSELLNMLAEINDVMEKYFHVGGILTGLESKVVGDTKRLEGELNKRMVRVQQNSK